MTITSLSLDAGATPSQAAVASSADTSRSTVSTAAADFATAMETATTGFVALMGGSISYNASTGSMSGTVGTSGGSVTLTQSHGNALVALLSTAGTDLVTANAAAVVSADVILQVGAGPLAAANLPRSFVLRAVDFLKAFVHADSPTRGGANTLGLLDE